MGRQRNRSHHHAVINTWEQELGHKPLPQPDEEDSQSCHGVNQRHSQTESRRYFSINPKTQAIKAPCRRPANQRSKQKPIDQAACGSPTAAIYIPVAGGNRFLTWYDHRSRWGAAGRLIDRFLFRPLICWATAWRFDCPLLGIDREVPPRFSLRMALIHAVARLGIFFIWLWQGLMPKLLFPSVDDRVMMAAIALPPHWLAAIGVIELVLAFATLLLWRWRLFFLLNITAMAGRLVAVAVGSPSYLVAAFNPVTLNAGMTLLSVIGYLAAAELPSPSRCLRRPRKESE